MKTIDARFYLESRIEHHRTKLAETVQAIADEADFNRYLARWNAIDSTYWKYEAA